MVAHWIENTGVKPDLWLVDIKLNNSNQATSVWFSQSPDAWDWTILGRDSRIVITHYQESKV